MPELIILQKEDLRAEISDVLDQKLSAFLSKLQPEQKSKAEDLLSKKEAAKLLGVSLNTLTEWAKEGKIIGYRISSRVRFKRSELEASLKRIKAAC